MNIELQSEILDNLRNVLVEEQNKIISAIEIVKNEGVSNYPVLICFQANENYELGIPLLNNNELACNLSTLEELYVKNIVDTEKVNNFRALYNHRLEHFCVLFVSENNPAFIFLPYNL